MPKATGSGYLILLEIKSESRLPGAVRMEILDVLKEMNKNAQFCRVNGLNGRDLTKKTHPYSSQVGCSSHRRKKLSRVLSWGDVLKLP